MSYALPLVALAVAILAVAIALLSFLVGPGVGPRMWRWLASKRTDTATRRSRIEDQLRTAAIFVNGMPLFLSETWNWGPSVPNYAAGGRLPDQKPPVPELENVAVVVNEALEFYVNHSRRQGRAYASLDETLAHFAKIQGRFWSAVEDFCEREYGVGSSRVISDLHALQIPNSEQDRIRHLKTEAGGTS